MQQRLIPAGDVELWVEDVGDPAAAPVLLITGANALASMWPDRLVEIAEMGHALPGALAGKPAG